MQKHRREQHADQRAEAVDQHIGRRAGAPAGQALVQLVGHGQHGADGQRPQRRPAFAKRRPQRHRKQKALHGEDAHVRRLAQQEFEPPGAHAPVDQPSEQNLRQPAAQRAGRLARLPREEKEHTDPRGRQQPVDRGAPSVVILHPLSLPQFRPKDSELSILLYPFGCVCHVKRSNFIK